MKNYFFASIILFTAHCTPRQQESGVSNDWEDLISGDQFEGWTEQGDFLTEVEQGVLTLTGEGKSGWLWYPKEFEDFIFETEFMVGPGNKSGIAFRFPDGSDGAPAFSGYMVNIDHNPDQQNPTGSIYNVSRAKWLKGTKTEDWNKMVIEAKGDHLKVFINDTLVTETHDRRSEEGIFGLRASEGSNSAKFRNVRVKEVEEPEFLRPQIEDYMRAFAKGKMEPLHDPTSLHEWSQIGDAVWEIEDGIIHGYSGEKGGFLIHKDIHRNFYLKLKFKIKHEDNSGIFIRHDPASKESVTTDNAIECNIYDHDGFTHEFSTGAIVPFARAWSKMIDYDDWNHMEIFAFEDQICMYVNGVKSSEAHLPRKFNQKGNICIQGGVQVFNDNLPSDIYIKDMFIRNFDEVPFLGY